MKIIIYSILLPWICMACVDALEMTPENSITFMNAFETEKELETSVLTTESVLRNRMTASTYGLIGYGEYSDYHYSYDYALLLEHDPAGYTIPWSDDYEVISHANVPLPYIDKINMPQERRDYYKGQLYFFKAFAYLDLIRRWGDCVLIRDQVEFEAQGQTPWPKVADYAINLAKKAVRLLPEWDELKDANGSPVTHRARPCKGAANALLANLCAWKAGCKYMAKLEDRDYDEQELWKTAEQACTDIIKREDIYQLASTPEDVCTSVLVGGSKESVFESLFRGYWNELEKVKGGAEQNMTSMGKVYTSWPVIPNQDMGDIQYISNRINNETVEKMFSNEDLRREAWFYKFEYMRDSIDSNITQGYAYPYKYRFAKVSTDGGISSPYHDCSIMEYLRKDTYNWELTVKLIERAGLTGIFEGNDPNYKEITFFAPPSYSILRYIWDNDMESVDELSINECKTLVLYHVLKGRYLKDDFAYRNSNYSINDEQQDGGTDVVTEGNCQLRIYRDKSAYAGVPDAGPETMYIYSFTKRTMVPLATPDIQPINGIVHALNYNYELGKI